MQSTKCTFHHVLPELFREARQHSFPLPTFLEIPNRAGFLASWKGNTMKQEFSKAGKPQPKAYTRHLFLGGEGIASFRPSTYTHALLKIHTTLHYTAVTILPQLVRCQHPEAEIGLSGLDAEVLRNFSSSCENTTQARFPRTHWFDFSVGIYHQSACWECGAGLQSQYPRGEQTPGNP